MSEPPPSPISLLRLPTVCARTGLSRSSLYRKIAERAFPAPIKLQGTRCAAWPSDAVDAWIRRVIEDAAR